MLGEVATAAPEGVSIDEVIEVVVEAYCSAEPLLHEAAFDSITKLAPRLHRDQLGRISKALAVTAWRQISDVIEHKEEWRRLPPLLPESERLELAEALGLKLGKAEKDTSALSPSSQADVEALATACVSPSPSVRKAAIKRFRACAWGTASKMASRLAALPLETFDLGS